MNNVFEPDSYTWVEVLRADSEWQCFVTLLGSPPNGCATPYTNLFLSCGLFAVFVASINISPEDLFKQRAS